MKTRIKQSVSTPIIKSIIYGFLKKILYFFGKKWKILGAFGRKRREQTLAEPADYCRCDFEIKRRISKNNKVLLHPIKTIGHELPF